MATVLWLAVKTAGFSDSSLSNLWEEVTLLHGEETDVFADSGYRGVEKRLGSVAKSKCQFAQRMICCSLSNLYEFSIVCVASVAKGCLAQ